MSARTDSAKAAGVTGKAWEALREAVTERDGRACIYCGNTDDPLHLDHLSPLTLGGGWAVENLVLACATCNVSKGGGRLQDWGGLALYDVPAWVLECAMVEPQQWHGQFVVGHKNYRWWRN